MRVLIPRQWLWDTRFFRDGVSAPRPWPQQAGASWQTGARSDRAQGVHEAGQRPAGGNRAAMAVLLSGAEYFFWSARTAPRLAMRQQKSPDWRAFREPGRFRRTSEDWPQHAKPACRWQAQNV